MKSCFLALCSSSAIQASCAPQELAQTQDLCLQGVPLPSTWAKHLEMAPTGKVLINAVTMPRNCSPLIWSEIYCIKPFKQFPEIRCHNSVFLSYWVLESIVIHQWEWERSLSYLSFLIDWVPSGFSVLTQQKLPLLLVMSLPGNIMKIGFRMQCMKRQKGKAYFCYPQWKSSHKKIFFFFFGLHEQFSLLKVYFSQRS